MRNITLVKVLILIILSKLKEVDLQNRILSKFYMEMSGAPELIDLRLINEICDKKLNEKELIEIFNAAHLINSTIKV